MLRPHSGPMGVICALALTVSACASKTPPAVVQATAPVRPVANAQSQVPPRLADPVLDLIAASSRHFASGEQELQVGHLEMAKDEFDLALEVLLESPYGARTEPRLRAHFDHLVERISAYEVTALAQGDGFTEKKYERASIDDLLAISTFEPPDASKATETSVAADLESLLHDIDIPLNQRVLSFVELFTGRLKGFLEDGLSRGARFLPMIQDVFRAEGLPLDLAYVPLVESAFKPNALSRAKAKGIWQFMSGTGLENGLVHDWYIDERAEPLKATRAAAKYLKTLNKMFDGDWHLALASYNGGPGRVQRAMKKAGLDDFWALSSTSKYLPRETRDYVPLILAAVIIAKNPAQYGMNVEPLQAPSFETVTLARAIDIRRIAEWAGSAVGLIQDLNPELRRWTTPVRASDYELRVPAGTAGAVRAQLAALDPADVPSLNWYTVRKGETLLSIARKLSVSRVDLAEANYLSQKARITVGQQLIIPRAPTLLLATRTDNPAPLAESRSLDALPVAKATVPKPENADQAKLVYRVRSGDTLFSIARVFNTTVAALKSWNRLRTNDIQAGQRLTIIRDGNATS